MTWLPKPYRNVSAEPDQLALGGLVERPNFGLRFEDLVRLPILHQVADVGAYAGAARIQGEPIRGVRIAALMELGGVEPAALYMIARTHGGFSASVWGRESARLAIIALARGAAPRPAELGGPVRLLLPGFKDESRDLYDLASIEFSARRAPDSDNRRARIPRPPSSPGEIQGGLTRVTIDPEEPRTLISPPP
jgi:hypothetical protein